MRTQDIKALVLLLIILHLSTSLKAQRAFDKSSAFYHIISKCVENFDSIRHLDSKYNHPNTYIAKIIQYEKNFNKVTVSITSIINGNILTNIKPFYYTFVGDEMVILSASTIPDISILGKEFFINDTNFKEKIKLFPYLIFDFNNYPIMGTPMLGIYSIEFSKRKNIGKVRYLIVNPIGLAPMKYRPIKEYNVDDKLDKYYHVYLDGEIPLRGKSPFEKHQNLEDMYDHEFEIRFDKNKGK